VDQATIGVIFQLIGVFVAVSTAAWVLGQRLEGLKVCLDGHTKLMEERMKSLDREMIDLKDAVKESRKGRVELWSELNELRERAAKLEIRADLD